MMEDSQDLVVVSRNALTRFDFVRYRNGDILIAKLSGSEFGNGQQ